PLGVLGGVLPGEEEDLPGPLVAGLPGEQAGAVAGVEGADVRVGLLEARVLAGGHREVADDVERVPAPGRPAAHRGDDDLGHRADEPLDLEDVQPAGAGRVDLLAALGRLGAGVGVLGLVAVAVAAADALVP